MKQGRLRLRSCLHAAWDLSLRRGRQDKALAAQRPGAASTARDIADGRNFWKRPRPRPQSLLEILVECLSHSRKVALRGASVVLLGDDILPCETSKTSRGSREGRKLEEAWHVYGMPGSRGCSKTGREQLAASPHFAGPW